jgi:hypothetical protein
MWFPKKLNIHLDFGHWIFVSFCSNFVSIFLQYTHKKKLDVLNFFPFFFHICILPLESI